MIAIYNYAKEWGGVDVLIKRFAEHLLLNKKSFLIIEPDGTRLRNDLPEVTFILIDQLELFSSRINYIFFPSVSKLATVDFPWQMLLHATFFTWVVHPNDVFRRFFPYSSKAFNAFGYKSVKILRYFFKRHTLIYDSFFNLLSAYNAIAIMDGACSRTFKFFVGSCQILPEIIQIPSNANFLTEAREKDYSKLSIGYLGRMDVMKWSAMQPFVTKILTPLAKERSVELVLISEGSHLERLQKLCAKHGIKCVSHGYMPNQAAREVILKDTLLAVAMGTSALDIAATGHPCVVIDPAVGFFTLRQKKFRFIHETTDFTLGEYRSFPGYVRGGDDFEDLITEVRLKIAAKAGFDYVSTFHNPEICFEKLLSSIHGSQLLVKDMIEPISALNDSFWITKKHPLRSLLHII